MKKAIIILCIVMTILLTGQPISASEFITETIPEDDYIPLSNIEFTVLSEEPEKRPIEAFDVRQDGWFAIVQSRPGFSNYLTVVLYNETGVFLTGFRFYSPGAIAVEWYSDGIKIHDVREYKTYAVDLEGNLRFQERFSDSRESMEHWYFLRGTQKKIGNVTYEIKQSGRETIFSSKGYYYLNKSDALENRQTLYKVTDNGPDQSSWRTGNLFNYTPFLIIILLAGGYTAYIIIKRRKNT